MAITQVITALPTAPDPATMTPAEFSTAAAAYVLAMKAMEPEINTWADQVNAIISGTAGDIASGINGATAKTTPVDADLMTLTDSAASWVLKKLTWANLKTTLGSIFAALNGNAANAFSASNFTTAQGLAFPATQNPSANANTLDDYREGTFTGTLTGCTTSPTYTFKYTKIGNQVSIQIDTVARVEGTSNAPTKGVTGMPSILWPLQNIYSIVVVADNGGVGVTGMLYISPADGSINFTKDLSGTVFTASGAFFGYPGMLSYLI